MADKLSFLLLEVRNCVIADVTADAANLLFTCNRPCTDRTCHAALKQWSPFQHRERGRERERERERERKRERERERERESERDSSTACIKHSMDRCCRATSREMAIYFATWVSVLPGTRTTSCHVVDRDLSRFGLDPRTTTARFAGMHGRQGVRFGKTGEANPRSTSTPTASVCGWAWVRVDLRRRGVESGFQSQLNWSLASTAYRRRRRLASCLPLAGRIKDNGNANV